MYGILISLDLDAIMKQFPDDDSAVANIYYDIRKSLEESGFYGKCANLYVSRAFENKNAVDCVLAAQRLAKKLPWLVPCLKSINMLRIEDYDDLMPAIDG